MSQQFDFHPYYVLDAIKSKYFAVPRYQRSYSWEEVQLEDFWGDMQSAIQSGGDYFLGSFVLSNEDQGDYFSIIDGQQRVATTTILLATMRDVYAENGREKLASSFDEKYLEEHDVIKDERRRRIRLNTVDDDFYNRFIIKNEAVVPSSDSHRRLRAAKLFFRSKLDAIVHDNPNWPEFLARISHYLQSQARVVVVTTASDADAFTIFETLNDRGADLTIADLLKNYLFSVSKAEIDTVQKYWTDAITTLENVQKESEFVSFLRQLWSSYYGATRERDLYRQIKKRIKTVQSAVEFAKQIKDGAVFYRAITASESDYWQGFDKRTRGNVAFIISQNIQQTKPLLLSALSTLPKQEVTAIIKNLVSWIVRSIVAGNPGGGQAERYYSDAAVAIRKGEIKSAPELLLALQPVIPNDTGFRDAFSVMPVKRTAQARYFLHAIERYLTNQDDPELVPNEEAVAVNLEHILPQNPKDGEWTDFNADQAAAYTHRLGNMTLLRRSENQKLGNGQWDAKRTALSASKLKLNEELAATAVWDIDSINLRQSTMSDHAVKVWPLLS